MTNDLKSGRLEKQCQTMSVATYHHMLHGDVACVGGDGMARRVDDRLFDDAHIARTSNEAFTPARYRVGFCQQAPGVQAVPTHSPSQHILRQNMLAASIRNE